MFSDKVSRADNQQERLEISNWLTGFTDGEGAFTVSILKNPTSRIGWQVFPEFIVTQGAKSKEVLYLYKQFFDCGNVYVNKRFDNHNEDIYRFCVRSIKDLNTKVIPFFINHKLRTHKRFDFEIFCDVMKIISIGERLHTKGLENIARLAMKMNHKVKPKFLESPLTICQTPEKGEEIVASA